MPICFTNFLRKPEPKGAKERAQKALAKSGFLEYVDSTARTEGTPASTGEYIDRQLSNTKSNLEQLQSAQQESWTLRTEHTDLVEKSPVEWSSELKCYSYYHVYHWTRIYKSSQYYHYIVTEYKNIYSKSFFSAPDQLLGQQLMGKEDKMLKRLIL